MLLATRCPFCSTAFRIQPAHLAVRRGLVRCGHCKETFDASGSLFELPPDGDLAAATPVAGDVAERLARGEAVPETVAAPAVAPLARERPVPTPAPAASAADFSSRNGDARAPRDPHAEHAPYRYDDARLATAAAPPAAPQSAHWSQVAAADAPEPTLPRSLHAPADEEDNEPHLFAAGPGRPAAAAAEPFAALPPAGDATHFALTRETPAQRPRSTAARVFGVLVVVLLVLLLAAQLAWWLRDAVLTYVPAARPAYDAVCAQLGCHVGPARNIDGIELQPVDLRQVDDPHKLELRVPLRNRLGIALAYPAFELTLLDRQNNVLLRRVLQPKDYMSPNLSVDAGLPPHATQTMVVRLDTGSLVAANFRIEIFYLQPKQLLRR